MSVGALTYRDDRTGCEVAVRLLRPTLPPTCPSPWATTPGWAYPAAP
ncbi:hypothetical protein NCC78_03170 [Micromonospora phytophila]|nr:hypothetical protein [Micromonospora phytophila]MCM0673713.1 hypothetical protein [Micromonospora phytophila]